MDDEKLQRLSKALIDIKEKMKKSLVNLDGTGTYDRTHPSSTQSSQRVLSTSRNGDQEKKAVISFSIPRQLFVDWDRYLTLCKQLDRMPDSLVTQLNECVTGHGIMALDDQSATLNKRINTEFSRFMANYRRQGGAKRKVEASKRTNIIIFQDELRKEERSEVKVLSSSYSKELYVAIYQYTSNIHN